MKVKRGLLVCMLLVMLPPAARADLAAAAMPLYTVLKTERCDASRTIKRISVWAAVPDGLSSNDVQRVMAAAVTPHTNLHAVSVFVIREGEQPGVGPYTVGLCEWAPYGDWSRAAEGLSDPQRATYDVKIDLRDSYFTPAPKAAPPAMFGITLVQIAGLAAELEREVLAAQSAVWKRNSICNPPERKRAKADAIARVAANHKLTPDQAEKAWGAYRKDVH